MHTYVVKAHTYMYSYPYVHRITHKLIGAQVHSVYTCCFPGGDQLTPPFPLHLAQSDPSLPPHLSHHPPAFPLTPPAAGTV